MFTRDQLQAAHKHSIHHEDELRRSTLCGCFYCLATYPFSAIEKWIDERDTTKTALCPRCGIDSVLGDASGYPITTDFLRAMEKVWFQDPPVE